MARFVDPGSSRSKIDALTERWKERCLVESGSLLLDDRAIWSQGHLADFRSRLLDTPLEGTDQSFEEKLALQLDGAPDDVRWLAAELVAVYLLFAREAIGGETKRSMLKRILDPLDPEQTPGWSALAATMDEGIGNPGVGYNIHRDRQVGYLIDFCLRFKAKDPDERRRLLGEPWQLLRFADDASDGIAVREMRHILLHLLRPDEFERISSRTHKQGIVSAFREELLDDDASEDLDEQLYAIRGKLVELGAQPDAHRGILDFYYPPLRDIWDPGADRPESASDLDLLEYKKQIVLHGPPGTGKTHRTRELAAALIRRAALRRWGTRRYFSSPEAVQRAVDRNVRWVQLHPGYGYEEFVRGMRIAADGSTVHVDGILPRLVNEMADTPPEDRLPFVLVLDEINRTDLSRLFGEAFSLLENRERPVLLPGVDPGDEPRRLSLPDDLYVIGTMNLIDQSVEELDFALRRRFFWRPAGFDANAIVVVNEQRWPSVAPPRLGWDRAAGDIARLAERASALNAQIEGSPHLGPQYVLGHTYYFDAAYFAGRWLTGVRALHGGVLWDKRGKPHPSLEDLWTFSLEPLLAQYLAGLEAEARRGEMARLRAVLLDGVVR